MKKILDWFSGGVIKEVGKVIDNLFTTDEERIKAKNEVFKSTPGTTIRITETTDRNNISRSKW